jgi:ribonucleotide reductase alpha subunit
LHDLCGPGFDERYQHYEQKADRTEMRVAKGVRAVDLWQRLLTMLFETGHPWITFKDPRNIRSPQQHCGVVHSSNLCTEITLNTSNAEVAVYNLGSINLANHITENGLDQARLARMSMTREIDCTAWLTFASSSSKDAATFGGVGRHRLHGDRLDKRMTACYRKCADGPRKGITGNSVRRFL